MKRLAVLLLSAWILCGCSGANPELERALTLRQQLLRSSGCSFETEITADYEDKLFTFSMLCSCDPQGDITFTVTAPQSLSGITGKISESGGALTFEDKAICFPIIAEGKISPVSTPWLILKAMKGGYLKAAGKEAGLLRLTVDESYDEDALQLDIWVDENNAPVSVDILLDGSRILSASVNKFQIL